MLRCEIFWCEWDDQLEELVVCRTVLLFLIMLSLCLCSVMMQESRLTTLQKKHISECLKSKFGKPKLLSNLMIF